MCAIEQTGFRFTYIVKLKVGQYRPLSDHGYVAMAKTRGVPMNKDQIQGRVEEVKGKVKEATGVILDDKVMEIEGSVEKNIGKVQAGFGDVKEDIKENK